jgi:hypothetical protein
MTIEAFAKEVKEMQRLQDEYWKRRDSGVLEQSKAQEKLVKRMVKEILDPSLFGGE